MCNRLWPVALTLAITACAAPAPVALAPDVEGFSEALARLDDSLEAADARRGQDWTVEAGIAELSVQRARLVGGYGDYEIAVDALERGFALAPEGGGPHRARATVNGSLHRLPSAIEAVETARSRLLLDDRSRAELDLLRGELAWQAGDYDQAFELVEAVAQARPTWRTAATTAHQAWHILDDAGAEQAFDAAEERIIGDAPVVRSWLHLQRGLHDLDRDRLDEAMAHYLDADQALPGWWLVHEHIAEVLVLTGREDQAEVIYLDVIDRTEGPEFMDAMASLELERGRPDAAQTWIDRAEARYVSQLEAFPEAAAGHALDHWLDFGPPDRAVEIARLNLQARPNAQAHGKLAAALLAIGEIDEASQLIQVALDTPWRDPDLLQTAEAVRQAGQR